MIALATALVALYFFVVSCGRGDASKPEGVDDTASETCVVDRSTVDEIIEELDSIMDSVDPDDFDDSQLSDSELGL
ncbi:MAG: hypothetical protein SWK76_07920 [Actinomycetota bacterium]|nr:hypothetical protein [Actinomycetota bacterium]